MLYDAREKCEGENVMISGESNAKLSHLRLLRAISSASPAPCRGGRSCSFLSWASPRICTGQWMGSSRRRL